MEQPVILSDVSFTYRSWTDEQLAPVISHLFCTLAPRSRTLVLGPYDGGKSTLARILCKSCPKYIPGELTGSISLFGYDLEDAEPWDLLTVCGYVSQNPQEQFVSTSVEDEIAFPLESLGLDHATMERRIECALARWGLTSLRTASEQELSGGERKRVLLAVLDAVDPPLWILDEPFDDLDAHWRDVLRQRILASGKTVLVLSSRYLAFFGDLFDSYALLEKGSLRFADEKTIQKDFAHLCGDDLPNPLVGQVLPDSDEHVLGSRDVETVRRRVSTLDEQPFSLSVPTFFLKSRETVALVGPNGSGKSTFSRLACGLDQPLSGGFTLDGVDSSAKALQHTVGYLFQNPDLQIFLPTVRDELSWSLKHTRHVDATSMERAVLQCAELFGLDPDATPATMSYPLRKALQAAVYYLLDRPFYILDELDNALTYATALSIMARLRRNGAGLLLITHDEQFAHMAAHTVCSITDGVLERKS